MAYWVNSFIITTHGIQLCSLKHCINFTFGKSSEGERGQNIFSGNYDKGHLITGVHFNFYGTRFNKKMGAVSVCWTVYNQQLCCSLKEKKNSCTFEGSLEGERYQNIFSLRIMVMHS